MKSKGKKKARAAIAAMREHTFALYRERNATLHAMGFKSYRVYLASDLWKLVRSRVFRKKGRICSLCPAPATSVHHNRYHRNDLLGKNLKFLNPICNACHEEIEFSRTGRKKPLENVANHFADKRSQWVDSPIHSIFFASDYAGE